MGEETRYDTLPHTASCVESVNIHSSMQEKSPSVNIVNNGSLRIKSQAIKSNNE